MRIISTIFLRNYIRFMRARRSTYLEFNKQLILGEMAGFGAGMLVAEGAASAGQDNFAISAYSSAADYGGSIAGFLGVYYFDYRSSHQDKTTRVRVFKVLKAAVKLWPSVLAGDVAFILVRPSLHYVSLSLGLEAGVAAALAHFLAFGVFNIVAIFSKSIVDYVKHVKAESA
ncbi:MAG TPA: hypothetical protein VJP79_02370 [Nitrososphaera sp.]|nr:hypothetical protein [Nitrososphaera sp.]